MELPNAKPTELIWLTFKSLLHLVQDLDYVCRVEDYYEYLMFLYPLGRIDTFRIFDGFQPNIASFHSSFILPVASHVFFLDKN